MKNLIKIIAFLVVTGSISIGCQSTSPTITTEVVNPETQTEKEKALIKSLEALIQERVVENSIPALSVGLIKNNKMFSYHNIGAIERGSPEKVTENTVYQLASLSKTFTGIIAKELVAEGKLDVNASITDYLPTSLSKATREKLKPITVRNLLQHKSGLPRDAEYAKRPWKIFDGPMIGGFSETALLQDLEELELIRNPGIRMEYSNLGFGIMGYIMERASGTQLAELYDKYLDGKYALKRTTMDLEEAKRFGMATPYMKWWRAIKTSPWEMGYLRSGGGLCSTVADLSKMMLHQMKAYQEYGQNPEVVPSLVLSDDKTSFGRSGFPYYGYGIMEFNKSIDTTMVHIGHTGDVDGFASAYIFFPNQEVGIVMLTSSGGGWFPQLEWDIQKLLLDIQPRKTITLPNPNFEQIAGTYKFDNGRELVISQGENCILTQSRDGAEYKAFPYATNKFYYLDNATELIFEDGRLRQLDNMGNSRFAKRQMNALTDIN